MPARRNPKCDCVLRKQKIIDADTFAFAPNSACHLLRPGGGVHAQIHTYAHTHIHCGAQTANNSG